jgi:hypothetical protein
MAYRDAIATSQAANDARAARYNGGTAQARTGAQPTNPDDAASGTLVGTLTFSATAFGATNSSRVATANSISSDSSADTSGTIGHMRFLTSGAAIVGDADCGMGSGTVNWDNNVAVSGGVLAISSMTLTQPAS